MTIKVKQNEAPTMKMPKFIVDAELHQKLNNYDLTKLLNKHNFSLFLGKAGSGKSSLCISMLQTPSLFKNIWHNIILFAPKNSRSSIKNNFWEKNLPSEQIYDVLNLENLNEAYNVAQNNAQEEFQTLIVLDDVQSGLKNIDIQKMLLHMVNNRRHARLSIWLLCQNYFTIPKQVRMSLTNLFIFKVSKPEIENIFTEQIELKHEKFQDIINNFYKMPHDYIFIDSLTKRIFLNFDEMIYEEE
jgi:hypothetical protein